MDKTVRSASVFLVCWFALSTLMAQKKPDADALFLQARDAAFAERYIEARKICRRLISYYPEYYDAYILAGRTYGWELKTDSAQMMILQLLDIEPDNYEVLILLVDNEIWGGRYIKALEFIDLAMAFYPFDENFLFKKAIVCYQNKDNTSAIKALYELFHVNPDHINGNDLLNTILPPRISIDDLFNKADEEALAGNWMLARYYCRQILSENPDYHEALLLMAQTFAFENKYDSARIISTKLYEINPQHYYLQDIMVNIELWNHQYKEALAQVEKALNNYPEEENFLFKKAKIQYLTKDYNNALLTLNKLLAVNPGHEEGNALKKDILENHLS